MVIDHYEHMRKSVNMCTATGTKYREKNRFEYIKQPCMSETKRNLQVFLDLRNERYTSARV